MEYIQVTADMVLKKLKMLQNSKSAGSDGIHPCILNKTAEAICIPLAMILTNLCRKVMSLRDERKLM